MAELARSQHGAVSHAQLLGLGLSNAAITRRLARGQLHRLHRGVYLVGSGLPSQHTALAAALLACGAPSVLSHQSAATLWDILRYEGDVHVTAIGHHAGRRAGIRGHRIGQLDQSDVSRRAGLAVTSPGRTLLDLAGAVAPRQLRWAVEEARVRRLVTDASLESTLARGAGRRGARRLAAIVRASAGPTFTRSEAERRLLDLIRSAGLPHPQTNLRIGGLEVDVVWREHRVVAEVDGFAFHGGRDAFERDRRRDARLQLAGYRVARLSWRQITGEPEQTCALLRRLLDVS